MLSLKAYVITRQNYSTSPCYHLTHQCSSSDSLCRHRLTLSWEHNNANVVAYCCHLTGTVFRNGETELGQPLLSPSSVHLFDRPDGRHWNICMIHLKEIRHIQQVGSVWLTVVSLWHLVALYKKIWLPSMKLTSALYRLYCVYNPTVITYLLQPTSSSIF